MSAHPRPRPPYTLRTSSSSVTKPMSSASPSSTALSHSPAHQTQQTMSSRAPLPSPTMCAAPFIPAFPVSATHSQQHYCQAQQHNLQQQQCQQQQQQHQQQQQQQQQQRPLQPPSQQAPHNQDYAADVSNGSRSAPETGNLLREYGLVAEAARRAQMAVLMRDMEGCEL